MRTDRKDSRLELRVSNLRTIARVHFRTVFESSKLPGAGPTFPDLHHENWP